MQYYIPVHNSVYQCGGCDPGLLHILLARAGPKVNLYSWEEQKGSEVLVSAERQDPLDGQA